MKLQIIETTHRAFSDCPTPIGLPGEPPVAWLKSRNDARLFCAALAAGLDQGVEESSFPMTVVEDPINCMGFSVLTRERGRLVGRFVSRQLAERFVDLAREVHTSPPRFVVRPMRRTLAGSEPEVAEGLWFEHRQRRVGRIFLAGSGIGLVVPIAERFLDALGEEPAPVVWCRLSSPFEAIAEAVTAASLEPPPVRYEHEIAPFRAAVEPAGWSIETGPGALLIRRPDGNFEALVKPCYLPAVISALGIDEDQEEKGAAA